MKLKYDFFAEKKVENMKCKIGRRPQKIQNMKLIFGRRPKKIQEYTTKCIKIDDF